MEQDPGRAAVLRYLERADPAAARWARERYACFEHFGEDRQRYGYATAFGMSPSCKAEVLAQLVEIPHGPVASME